MPFNLGMNEQTWYFYTTGYYSETQANDLWIRTEPWMALKGLVLNGEPHSALVQKLLLTTLCMRETHRTENRSLFPGIGKMGKTFQEGLGTDK